MPGGRPSKLTPEVQEKICKWIRGGNYPAVAAMAAGIAHSTFFEWLKRGARQRKGKYKEFSDAVEKARAEGESILVGAITRAAIQGDWKPAAWLLSRSRPRRWGGVDVNREDPWDPVATPALDSQMALAAPLRSLPPEQSVEVLKQLIGDAPGPPPDRVVIRRRAGDRMSKRQGGFDYVDSERRGYWAVLSDGERSVRVTEHPGTLVSMARAGVLDGEARKDAESLTSLVETTMAPGQQGRIPDAIWARKEWPR